MKPRPPHLRLLPEPAPETPGQAVRRRLKRQPRPRGQKHCPRCSGREYMKSSAGRPLCVPCLAAGYVEELIPAP